MVLDAAGRTNCSAERHAEWNAISTHTTVAKHKLAGNLLGFGRPLHSCAAEEPNACISRGRRCRTRGYSCAKMHITTPPLKWPERRCGRARDPRSASVNASAVRRVVQQTSTPVEDCHMVHRRAAIQTYCKVECNRGPIELCTARIDAVWPTLRCIRPLVQFGQAWTTLSIGGPSQPYHRKRGPYLSLRAICAEDRVCTLRSYDSRRPR